MLKQAIKSNPFSLFWAIRSISSLLYAEYNILTIHTPAPIILGPTVFVVYVPLMSFCICAVDYDGKLTFRFGCSSMLTYGKLCK